jgi:hypothetical protein
MSLAYRESRLSPDDDTKLKELVRTTATAKLVALVEAQEKKLRAHHATGWGAAAARPIHAIKVAARSVGLAKDQTTLLSRLIEQYGIEQVIQSIEREEALRHTVQDTLHVVMNLNEGAEKYYGQYETAIKSLDAFGINHKDAPTWNDIAARLTSEKLALIEKLEGTQLILVPPQSRQDLLKALDGKVGKHGMKREIYSYRLEDDQLWNNGKPENLAWEVAFVDGRQDLPYNEEAQAGKTAHKQVKALRALHEKDGVGTLIGARSYLTLMMQGLVANQPTDEKYWTVLNAEVVAKDEKALLGVGYWYFDQVGLYAAYPNARDVNLRLRGAVRV